jgi:hypothetical protein
LITAAITIPVLSVAGLIIIGIYMLAKEDI